MTNPSSIEERLARLEGAYEQINLRLGRLEAEIVSLGADLRAEIKALRSDTLGEINALRSEMKDEINALRSEMRGEIGALRSEMRGEIGALRSETNARIDRLFYTLLGLLGGVAASIVATILARLL